MCLSKAYIDGKDKKELLMDEIATVDVENGKLTLTSLVGEKKEIAASIKIIDFVTSSILLEKLKESP